jgi:hypothetical protein
VERVKIALIEVLTGLGLGGPAGRIRQEGEDAMRVYHRTGAAQSILSRGFREGVGFYLTSRVHRGVWLSDRPLDENDGAFGDTVLAVKIPIRELRSSEWVEEGKGYREFLVPARVVNSFGPPRVVDHDLAGFTEEEILNLVTVALSRGSEEAEKQALRIRRSIPFLKKHGLLRLRPRKVPQTRAKVPPLPKVIRRCRR